MLGQDRRTSWSVVCAVCVHVICLSKFSSNVLTPQSNQQNKVYIEKPKLLLGPTSMRTRHQNIRTKFRLKMMYNVK